MIWPLSRRAQGGKRHSNSIINEETAYVLKGSIAGFLIETYGLPMFWNLYDTGHYDGVHGKTLQTFEKGGWACRRIGWIMWR